MSRLRQEVATNIWIVVIGLFVLDRLLKLMSISIYLNEPSVGHPILIGVLMLMFVGIFVIGMWKILPRKTWMTHLAIGMVGVGGLSNAIDMVTLGGVVDYISVFSLWWNISDAIILLGIVVLVARWIDTTRV